MNDDTVNQIIDLILDYINTPVIYMFDHENKIDFIYVTDTTIDDKTLVHLQEQIRAVSNIFSELIDLRMFEKIDRLYVMKNSEMIFCGDDNVLKLIETAAYNDLKNEMKRKEDICERKKNCGVFYLQ